MTSVQENIAAWRELNIPQLLDLPKLPEAWVVSDRFADIAELANPAVSMVAVPFPHAEEIAAWMPALEHCSQSFVANEVASTTEPFKQEEHELLTLHILTYTDSIYPGDAPHFGDHLVGKMQRKLKQEQKALQPLRLIGDGLASAFNILAPLQPYKNAHASLQRSRGWMPHPRLARMHHDRESGYRAFVAFNIMGTILGNPDKVQQSESYIEYGETQKRYPAYASLPAGSLCQAPMGYLLTWRKSGENLNPESPKVQPHGIPAWLNKTRYGAALDID